MPAWSWTPGTEAPHTRYAFEDPQAVSFLAGIADVCAERGYGMTILPITGAADDTARIRAKATVEDADQRERPS